MTDPNALLRQAIRAPRRRPEPEQPDPPPHTSTDARAGTGNPDLGKLPPPDPGELLRQLIASSR